MLEARNLTKKFPSGDTELVVFDHLNFQAKEGEFIVITGRSGSGKSTLLYQIGLLDVPTAGEIIIDDLVAGVLSNTERSDVRLQKFGYVFQDYGLLPELTAQDNVMLTLLMSGIPTAKARVLASEALSRVGLTAQIQSKSSRLSGGQQQRVSIARALAHNPKYIIADEPTANLDSATAATILQVFSEIHRQGQSIIMVTHEKESLALADIAFELLDGQLVQLKGLNSTNVSGPSSMLSFR